MEGLHRLPPHQHMTVLVVDTESFIRSPFTSNTLKSPSPHEILLSALHKTSEVFSPTMPGPDCRSEMPNDLRLDPISSAPQDAESTSAKEHTLSWSYTTSIRGEKIMNNMHIIAFDLKTAGMAGLLAAMELWMPALVVVRVPRKQKTKKIQSNLAKVFRVVRLFGTKTLILADVNGAEWWNDLPSHRKLMPVRNHSGASSYTLSDGNMLRNDIDTYLTPLHAVEECSKAFMRIRSISETEWGACTAVYAQNFKISHDSYSTRHDIINAKALLVIKGSVEFHDLEDLHALLNIFARLWVRNSYPDLHDNLQRWKSQDSTIHTPSEADQRLSDGSLEDWFEEPSRTDILHIRKATSRLERWSLKNEVRVCETPAAPLFFLTSDVDSLKRGTDILEASVIGHGGVLEVDQCYWLGPCKTSSRSGKSFAYVKVKQIIPTSPTLKREAMKYARCLQPLEPAKVQFEVKERTPPTTCDYVRDPGLLRKPFAGRGARIIVGSHVQPQSARVMLCRFERLAARELGGGSEATAVFAGRRERAVVVFWAGYEPVVLLRLLDRGVAGLVTGEPVALLGIGRNLCMCGSVVAISSE
ncbi:uncharacterized protein V2V93DRAFT_378931 [Kockiozyma suomiensis]|uniref:uncharacterized protein n=1 Tax=Kockiozyma suomiensis TaxID=1337062 RepID=UPI0033436010